MKKIIPVLLFFLLMPFSVMAEEVIDRTGFIATATSDWNDGVKAQNLMDGNLGSIWHADPNHALPISVTIDMGKMQSVGGIRVTFRESETNGFFQEGKIYKSDDGEKFTQIAEINWNGKDPVSTLWFHEEEMRFLKITVTKATAGHAIAREIELLRGGEPMEKQVYMDTVPTDDFEVTASSTKEGNEIKYAFDNNKETHWHSYFKGKRDKPPYTIDINMGRTELISGIVYWPRAGARNGYFTNVEIYTSEYGKEYTLAGTAVWSETYERKAFYFAPVFAKYVRLIVKESTVNYGLAAEISIAYDAEASNAYKQTHHNRYVLQAGETGIQFENSRGEKTSFPVENALIQKYGTMYVPLRGLFEAMGGTVEWNSENMTVAVSMASYTYTFQVEDKRFTRNDKRFTLKEAPILLGNRVYLPMTFMEMFLDDYVFAYDEASKRLTIEIK